MIRIRGLLILVALAVALPAAMMLSEAEAASFSERGAVASVARVAVPEGYWEMDTRPGLVRPVLISAAEEFQIITSDEDLDDDSEVVVTLIETDVVEPDVNELVRVDPIRGAHGSSVIVLGGCNGTYEN